MNRECSNKAVQRVKEWRKNNPEKLKKHKRDYYEKHYDEVVEYNKGWAKRNPDKKVKAVMKWQKKNSDKVKMYKKKGYENLCLSEKGLLNKRIRTSIYDSLHRRNKNGRKWQDLVGYDLDTLKRHLEKTLPFGYTWQDYMDGKLHVDHKIPISVFNFNKPEDIDFKKCWSLSNLQLLPKKENLRKGIKLLKPFQPSFSFS